MNSRDKLPQTMRVETADWEADGEAIRQVRHTVFSIEQGIDKKLDFDGRDRACVHMVARIDGECVGTARMLPDGHVGRIAVHAPWRGRGVGTRLVEHLAQAARESGMREIYLHSQIQAADFYARLQFEARGEPFMEAGVEHVLMVRTL